MKHAALICAVTTTVLTLLFAGCGGGGKDTHDISTQWSGSIYGVYVRPYDGETDIPTSAAIKVSWPDPSYRPPTDFTFDLDVEDTPGHFEDVNTREMTDYSDPSSNYWWFEPTTALEPGKWYKLTLNDGQERENVVFFRTSDTLAMASGTRAMSAMESYRPGVEKSSAARSADPGAPTLTIRTK